MKAEHKLARGRLSVLELAEALGNVSEACRRRGISRTQFYEYKRRFQTHGIDGLKDLPPVHKSHPMSTPEEVQQKIVQMSLSHPAWGCNRISDQLRLQNVSVSAPTVQNILNKKGIGSRYERWLRLEQETAQKEVELTAEQVSFIEKQNPCFRERHVESSRPGELLNQDTFFVGHLKGVGKVYLHAVVDTYSSYAFGFLHVSKQPEAAVAVLHNEALPFYSEKDLEVENVLTDNGKEFCGSEGHPYRIYLELNEIGHRTTKVRHPQTNGFVERFNRTMLDEFFRKAFREKLYESVEALQKDLDEWLYYYNRERPHQGYRNMGRRPIERIDEYLKNVRRED